MQGFDDGGRVPVGSSGVIERQPAGFVDHQSCRESLYAKSPEEFFPVIEQNRERKLLLLYETAYFFGVIVRDGDNFDALPVKCIVECGNRWHFFLAWLAPRRPNVH